MNQPKNLNQNNGIMKVIAKFIVKYRFLIMVVFLAAALYCGMSISRVKVNEDITAFLPEDTETRQGLTVMEDEFITYGTADIMVSNITYETAEKLAEHIGNMEHVTTVTLDDSPSHYVNSSALLSVSFDGTSDNEKIIYALSQIKDSLKDYTITAPISGTITSLNIKDGDMAAAGTPAAVISNVDTMKIAIKVDEYSILNVEAGKPVLVYIDSIDSTCLQSTESRCEGVGLSTHQLHDSKTP